MEPITLAELTALADLQIRVDRKYVLPRAALAAVLAGLCPTTRVLDIDGRRSFRYASVYFDTPELTSFRLAARRRRRRFKIRTRTYVDSAQCWLEIKTEGVRGGTVKDRLPYETAHHACLEPGREFIDAVVPVSGLAFAPVLVTRYHRTTLYLPDSASRVTIDVQLGWRTPGHDLWLPEVAVVETKSGSAACQVDRLLWGHGHRPASISKYATGLAALRPDLPATPWRRTLRRHFAAGRPVAADPAGWLSPSGTPDRQE
jgi:VTC domain-containing protein